MPLIAGVADDLENIGIIIMLKSYLDLSQLLAITTNIFSIVKSMATTLYFVVLIITMIILGIRIMIGKKVEKLSY